LKNWTLPFVWLRLRWHILFWVIVIIYQVMDNVYRNDIEYWGTLKALLPTLPFDMLSTYISIYYLLPRFLLKQKYFLFALWLIVISVPLIFIELVIGIYIQAPILLTEDLDMSFFSVERFINVFIMINLITLFATAIKFIKLWFVFQQEKAMLKTQTLTSELALLRSQINPHFLFNTLNNIDSLVYINPEKASNSIIKLSEIMRYMLYEAGEDFVPLEKEIDYIKSFVSLQKIRLKTQNYVEFNLIGNVKGNKIPPMLIIPFVENAFKHGKKNAKSPGIIIDINIQDDFYTFEIVNYVTKIDSDTKDRVGGIGLQNIKRRLELLYKNKYELDIIVKDGQHRVFLKILK
jgi:LytS/YehU family sensor histidine kinase